MDELKNRKTTRLKGADYNRNQAVFLTICTKERRCILSRTVGTGRPRRSANRIDKIRTNRWQIHPSIERLLRWSIRWKLCDHFQSYPHYAVGKRRGKRTVDAGPYSTEFHPVTVRVHVQKILQQRIRNKYMAISLQWSYNSQPSGLWWAFAIYLWKPYAVVLWRIIHRRIGVWALPCAFVIQRRNWR